MLIFMCPISTLYSARLMFSGTTLISLARLRQEFYGLPADTRLFHERAAKEAVHEISHALGSEHCPDRKCVMYFSNSIRDTDRKGPGLCMGCKDTLGI